MKRHFSVYLILIGFLLSACGEASLSSSLSSMLSSINTSSEGTSSLENNSSESSLNETSSSIATSSSSDSSSSNSSSTTPSSSSPSSSLTSQDRVDLDLASVSYALGMSLPSLGTNRSAMTWVSSHPDIISSKGAYVNLKTDAEAVDVTLTLSAKHGSITGTREFVVNVQPTPEQSLTRNVLLPFVNTSEEYLVADQPEVPVYFTETGTIPYMDVATFMEMVDGAVDFDLLTFTEEEEVLTVSYTLEDEDENLQPIFYNYEAVIDFELNTFSVEDFSFFGNYVMSTETDFSDGLVFLGGIGNDAQMVTIPLNDYRIDLVRHNGDYMMPISILNLLFLHALYFDVYYNGDEIYGFDTFTALDSTSTVLSEMKTSSLNTAAMALDLRQSTYHFLALAFDYFYGLKNDKDIVSFYDYVATYADKILTGSDKSLYAGLFSFVYGLDDLHSWHESAGFYEATSYNLPLTSLSQLGQNTQNYYQGRWAIEDLMEAAYGANPNGSPVNPPSLRLMDDNTIAVILIQSFTVDTPDEVNAVLQTLPETVQSVVLDLSNNGGGNVGAVFRLLGYMTEETIQYSSMNPTDGSAATYFYESDYVAYDYEWFIMTSSVTFSAANLMTAMAKEMGVATIIGTKSSGGAASIGLFVTPDGTILLRSTNNVFATVTVDENEDRSYTSVESGVVVDYNLDNPFNNTAITNLINQIQST